MGVLYGWLVPEQVIYSEMSGDISISVFKEWAWEINPYYDLTPYARIHIVIDASNVNRIPSIKEMLDIPVHEKRGWVIIIGLSNKLMQFIASTMIQITRTEIKFVNTLDDAVTILRRVDPSLPAAISTHVVLTERLMDSRYKSV